MRARVLSTIVLMSMIAIVAGVGHAEIVAIEPPLQINATSGTNATMAIPRWKGYMDPNDPRRFWAMHSGSSSGATNIVFTVDSGETWRDTGMQALNNGYLDFHASMFGYGGDLFITAPNGAAVKAAHWEWPADSNADQRVLVDIPGTTAGYRSNNMVDGNGRWWVFTRYGDNPNENVEYAYSDNNGDTWTYGDAFDCNHADVRIGSMPAADGTPLLVVLYLVDDRGYEYYKWNGNRFVALPDHSIWAEYIGWERRFTHNMVGDYFHLIFRIDGRLRHVWKRHNGGEGSWNTSLVPTGASSEIAPVSTVRGDELYLFYSLRTNDSNAASSRVRAIVWNQNTRSWSQEYEVSTSSTAYNIQPNTCFNVPISSDYVPVFWNASSDGSDIMFSKLIVSTTHTDTPDVEAAGATLLPPYPNPFNPRTVIPYELPRDASVRLAIHDLAGRLVTVLADGARAEGRHEVTWVGRDCAGNPLPSGVYHARLTVGGEVSTRRVTLVR